MSSIEFIQKLHDRGMRAQAIATCLGMSPVSVYGWLRGTVKTPSPLAEARICELREKLRDGAQIDG